MIEYRHKRKHPRKKEKHAVATNTTINYTKLADAAADTYTSARDALNRDAANLAIVEGDRRGYQDIITADGHISVPLFNV